MLSVLISTDTRYPVSRKIIRKAVSDVLLKNKIEHSNTEVSVSVVGERKMKELSKTYLGDDENHEILSFSLEEITATSEGGFISPPDGVLRLGDIVLCWPEVVEAASRDNVMIDHELYLLTCHGVWHLLGKHHE